MYSVYVLRSVSLKKFYIGQTENLDERLNLHFDKMFDRAFTKGASDWKLFLQIPCNSRTQAIKIESHIKKMKSKVYIENLAAYPEMIEKLMKNYV